MATTLHTGWYTAHELEDALVASGTEAAKAFAIVNDVRDTGRFNHCDGLYTISRRTINFESNLFDLVVHDAEKAFMLAGSGA